MEIVFKKKKNNHRNRNKKYGSAGDRECFWKKQTHIKKRKDYTEQRR